MNFELSNFKLSSPTSTISYWFVSYDFAEVLGVEESRDAAKILKNLLKDFSFKLDYESDEVILRISQKKFVIPILTAIYKFLSWDANELLTIEPQVLAFKRPRKYKVSIGDVFYIPVTSELVGLGQIVDINYASPTVAISNFLGSVNKANQLNYLGSKIITILHTSGNSLYDGVWPVIGSTPVIVDPASGPGGKAFTVGSRSYGGDGPVVNLLLAYAGIQSWKHEYYDAYYLKKLLITK